MSIRALSDTEIDLISHLGVDLSLFFSRRIYISRDTSNSVYNVQIFETPYSSTPQDTKTFRSFTQLAKYFS